LTMGSTLLSVYLYLDKFKPQPYTAIMPTQNISSRITLEPDKRGGRPCVRGLRVTVYDVLEMLAEGMSEIEILEDFPELESADIRACLMYAANREHNLYSLAI